MSKDLNGQKTVKTVFAIVDEQHILLSDTICGHNGLEGQFGSSAMELEKAICDSFGIDKRNIRVEQIEQHILLSDTICGHNGLEGQFGSSAMELEKAICDSFGIDKRNIRVEQIEQFL